MKRIINIFSEYLITKDTSKLVFELRKVEEKIRGYWLCVRFNDSPLLYTIAEIETDLKDENHSNYGYLIALIKSGIENKNIKID